MIRRQHSRRTQGATNDRLLRRAPRALAATLGAVLVAGLAAVVAAPAHAATTVTISGSVRDEQGHPVSATVQYYSWVSNASIDATTKADGTFTISGATPGKSDLTAAPVVDDHVLASVTWDGTKSVEGYGATFTVPSTSVSGVDFVLPAATGILGTATDLAGNPLPNIGWTVLEWRPEEQDWYPPQMGPLTTDEKGQMWWRTEVGKTYRLCFMDDFYVDDDWVPAQRYADRCWDDEATQDTATDITVTATSRRQELTVALTPAGKSLVPGTPWVTGSAAVGGLLTVDPGTWLPGDTALTYQWGTWEGSTRVDFPGATGRTYSPTAAQAGDSIFVVVTGTRAGYKTASQYGYAGTAGMPTPTLSTPLTISGTPTVGSTLQVKYGTVTPATDNPAMFTWFVDGRATSQGMSSGNTSYVVAPGDVGKRISVHMSVSGSSGYNELHAAASTVVTGTLTAPKPTISGTLAVGSTLTAKPGTWGPAPVTLGYQWYRAGSKITGATASTYKLTSSDQAKTLTVHVIGTKTGYARAETYSSPTTAIQGVLTAPTPTISGTRAVGSKLTAVPGTWGPAPVTLKYQWYRAGTAISGATASTYTLTTSDRAKTLTVHVTGSKSGYVTAVRGSAATAAILGKLTTKTPTVSGTAKVGQTLKATAGTWGPSPVTLSYQWYRGSSAISGAKSSSYKLVTADKGATIKVRVTGTKSGYLTASTYSAASAKVG